MYSLSSTLVITVIAVPLESQTDHRRDRTWSETMQAITNNKCYLNNTMPGKQTGTDNQTPCGGLSVDFMSRVLVFMGMMLGNPQQFVGSTSSCGQTVQDLPWTRPPPSGEEGFKGIFDGKRFDSMNRAAWYDSKGFLPFAGDGSAAPVLGPVRPNELLQDGHVQDSIDYRWQGSSVEKIDFRGINSTDGSTRNTIKDGVFTQTQSGGFDEGVWPEAFEDERKPPPGLQSDDLDEGGVDLRLPDGGGVDGSLGGGLTQDGGGFYVLTTSDACRGGQPKGQPNPPPGEGCTSACNDTHIPPVEADGRGVLYSAGGVCEGAHCPSCLGVSEGTTGLSAEVVCWGARLPLFASSPGGCGRHGMGCRGSPERCVAVCVCGMRRETCPCRVLLADLLSNGSTIECLGVGREASWTSGSVPSGVDCLCDQACTFCAQEHSVGPWDCGSKSDPGLVSAAEVLCSAAARGGNAREELRSRAAVAFCPAGSQEGAVHVSPLWSVGQNATGDTRHRFVLICPVGSF